MTNKLKLAAGLLSCALIAGCGGGSSGSNDDTPAFGVGDPKIDFFPQKPSLLSNPGDFPIEANSPYYTQFNIKVTAENGFIAPAGTVVDLQVSNAQIAVIGIPDRPETDAINESAVGYVAACLGTNSGIASFFIYAGPVPGVAQFTASVPTPLQSGVVSASGCTTTSFRTYSRQFNYTINPGPAPFKRLDVFGRTTLPVNTANVAATPSSPFLTPVEVTQRDALGNLVNDFVVGADGSRTQRVINILVQRTDLLALSVPDKLSTSANEFTTLTETVTADLISGKALFYVHSRQRAGSAPVTIRAIDPVSGALISQDLNMTVGSTTAGIAQISISADSRAVYVANSNANTVLPVQIRATDDLGESGADPAAGVNNLLLEIVNPSGESLVSTSASGAAVEGTSIRTRTIQGLQNATFRASTRQGLIQIRATADRSDNNVDNGIQAPIFATRPVIVSDGKLFNLKITNSLVGTLLERKVTTNDFLNGANGTYGALISVSATDRQGNPVLPNTAIEFGIIDAPSFGYPFEGAGQFEVVGVDGDPVEGGLRFNAPTGAFTTAGGGVGPGDTLLLFGEGNALIRDLESARLVSRVISPTALDIASSIRFNLNDDVTDGIAVDRGPVVPYAIGRATIGNVTNSRLTDQFGVASTTINYPVSKIGHIVAVWARGVGDTPRGQTTPEFVTDVDVRVFPAADGDQKSLDVAPETIPLGPISPVQICLRDNLRNPIPSVFIRYGFNKVIGTVDGGTTGIVRNPTGPDGCTIALVKAVGTGDGEISFSAIGLTKIVKITKISDNALYAFPGQLGGTGGRVTLRLVDAIGTPIQGASISVSCDDGAGISTPPGTTNEQGETFAVITANLDGFGSSKSSKCTFKALGAEAEVKLQGVDLCSSQFSPQVGTVAGCPTPVVPPPANRTLTVNLLREDGNFYTAASPSQVQVIGNAGGINCVSTSTTPAVPGQCISGQITEGTTVSLIASTGINGAPTTVSFCRWTGAAGCTGTQPAVQVVIGSTNLICNATFSTTGPAGCPTQ